MEECLSEASERSKHQSSNKSDKSKDAQMISESKSAQLATENAQLTKENSILKAQVEQAIALEPKIEQFLENNKKLVSENRRLSNEIDDIKKRFLILQKSNSDLKKQVEEEKQYSQTIQKQFIDNSKEEIEKAKSNTKSQVSKITKQLEELQSKSEKDDMTIKAFNHKFERLLENAQLYFNQKFNDIDGFITFLKGPKMNSIPNQTNFMQQESPQKLVTHIEK